MKLAKLLILSILLNACVSTHAGKTKQGPIKQLVSSCALNPELKNKTYQAISCTFENKSQEAISLQIQRAEFASDQVRIVEKAEADALVAAWQEQKVKDRHNRKVGALAVIGGGIIAILTGDAQAASIGMAAAGSAASYDSVADASDAYREKQYGQALNYASHYLLGQEIIVPAEMFVRRSLLVKSSERLTSIVLCFAEQKSCQTYSL